MESKIAEVLNLKYNPVALIWTDEKPENALQFGKEKWGCVMDMFANAAAKGRTVVFDRETYGCWGGGTGLGFGNQYVNFPGGIECFYYFLSTGNEQWETGKEAAKKNRDFMSQKIFGMFMHGEGFVKSPKLTQKFVESIPIVDIPAKYVVFKPLKDVDLNKEKPVIITFLADPDQLSALVVLANYGRDGVENVISPMSAGCQGIGVFPYREAKSENPRAVIGLTDIFARGSTRRLIGKDLLSFAVPWNMFQDMEDNVEGSFLQKAEWKALIEESSQ